MSSPGEALLHIRELAKARDIEGLISELENPFEDEVLTVRGRAADHLGSLRAEEATEPLIRMLQTDPNEHARTHAVRALGQIGTPNVLPTLRKALEDPALAVRAWAALNLATLRDQAAVPALIGMLSDREPVARRSAAKALLKIGDPVALKPLQAMTEEEEGVLRRLRLRLGTKRLENRGNERPETPER
jgi:HEAT repeat protein